MADLQPQCKALTADGKQCRNSSRGTSKYCASHKGYQPPAAKGLAQRIEGGSWSPRDKLTNRQSARNADTRPRVGGARDTVLATRHAKRAPVKAAKAERKPAKAQPRPAKPIQRTVVRRPAPPPMREETSRQDPGYVATLLQPERDYLVVFEEPDPDGVPTDDGLLLDIDAGQPVSLGEVDLEQKLDLELNNDTTAVGRLGFILSIIGGILALGTCAYFAVVYPEKWYVASGEVSGSSVVPTTALLAVFSFLLMLAGVVLTHYGRRIQARGNLSRMRIVEKAFQPRVALGDEFAQR